MLKIIFTLDYEIHGNGEGDPHELMVEPTDRMLDLFEHYGAKLTIMADVAEILKFKEYQDAVWPRRLPLRSNRGSNSETPIRRGHDVQLHLHSSYFNARFEDGRWAQDWSEYNFAGLSVDRITQIVRTGKEFLETLLQPLRPDYRCLAFRAANWSVSPAQNVVRGLLANGLEIDSSVFKYGRRDGIVNFDYSHAHSAIEPWPAAEDDLCRRDPAGKLTEVPIYCERRWIGAFLTWNRMYRVRMSRAHRVQQGATSAEPAWHATRPSKLRPFSFLMRRHAWKADFNQCSGRQLARALRRAEKSCSTAMTVPFVMIGHSKLFTNWNAKSLAPFLAGVRAEPRRFSFGTFCEGPAGQPWLGATGVPRGVNRETIIAASLP